MVKNGKNKADMLREERKKQLLKFIEKKKMKVLPSQSAAQGPLKENKKVQVPYVKKEEKPREIEKTYINGSSRRKKRREKLAEVAAQKEDIRKKNVLAVQQERQKKLDEEKRRRDEKALAEKEERERRNEEKNRKKLEALKAGEEVKLRREHEKKARLESASKKAAAAKLAGEIAVNRKQSLVAERNKKSLKNKEELISRLESLKEKHNIDSQQRLLQKQLALAGRKAIALRRSEEKKKHKEEALNLKKEALKAKEQSALLKKEEENRKKAESLKLKEEARLRREHEKKARFESASKKAAAAKIAGETAVEQDKAVEVPDSLPAKRKAELLEFIKTRRLLNEQNAERKKILKSVAGEKRSVPVVVPVPIPVSMPAGKIRPEAKPPISTTAIVPAKPVISAAGREEQKKVAAHIAVLAKESGRINNVVIRNTVGQSVQSAQKFINAFRKKPVSAGKKALAPAAPARSSKKVAAYREPFLLLPFIRKNAFKVVFLLLCIAWFVEIFMLMRKFQEPQQRLSAIVGGELFTDKSSSERESVSRDTQETEKLVIQKPERIDIEGKRDPFSPGRLTMNVLDRPSPTSIVLAPRPEVISILRPARVVSVIREDKRMEPDRVSDLAKPQAPAFQSILKTSPAAEVPVASALAPLEKIQTPEPSPLIMPEMRCDLVYRGRMLVEGVEYLFIEGRQRTYRVTVGDVVEGFRILRKENNRLHLSKDGALYEIAID